MAKKISGLNPPTARGRPETVKTYLVGGAIRDRLLGRTVEERDFVVVGATVEELKSQGYVQVGRDFPVFLHPRTREEYALARTERKVAPGYQGFTVYAAPDVTLEQDLERRDLTINALAEDEDGTLIDPWGGMQDLEKRLLRHVSPAFAEDPVRILRVARFMARYANLDFRIADETLALMKAMVVRGEVDALVPERVWQELAKALGDGRPSLFFQVLRRCHALERLFPELERLFNIPGDPPYSDTPDTGSGALRALDTATGLSSSSEVRFAALTHALDSHSIGKLCERMRAPGRFLVLAQLVAALYNRLPGKELHEAEPLLELMEKTDAIRRPERFEQFLVSCEAICRVRAVQEPHFDLFRRILTELRGLNIGALVAGMKDSVEIQRRIREERLSTIDLVIRNVDADN